MNRLRVLSIVLLIIMASTAAAQSSPRTAPTNDNFASALPLPVGTPIKVKNISAATLESSEPLPCFQGGHHSVWFTFTPAVNTTLYLSTSGTNLFAPINGTNRVLLDVYIGTELSALDWETCGSVSLYHTTLTHVFEAGVTYAIQLGTRDDVPYGADAFYKLTARVTELELNPSNRDFESSFTPDNWTLTSDGNTDISCGYQAYPALFGNCALKLEGSAGQTSKLTQTVNIPSDYRLSKNGMAVLYVYYRGMYVPTIGHAKLRATVTYADGTPPTILTINLTGLAAADIYQVASTYAYLKPGTLTKVKIKVIYKGEAGALMLDYVGLGYGTALIRQGSFEALPVPPPADGF